MLRIHSLQEMDSRYLGTLGDACCVACMASVLPLFTLEIPTFEFHYFCQHVPS